MRKMGIQVKRKKRFIRTTDSSHNLRVYPNLIKNLAIERIDQVWCSDYSDKKVIPTFEHDMLKA